MIEKDVKQKMEGAIEHFKKELRNLRTNRANPGLLEGVMVELYGTPMPLKALANISVAEARQLLVHAFDPSSLPLIAKEIATTLGLQAAVEGHSVRVSIPPLNEEMRKEIAKQGKKKAEEAKVVIREIRRKGNDSAKKGKDEGSLTEDQLKGIEKKIQELTDGFCKEIDTLFKEKEAEILEV